MSKELEALERIKEFYPQWRLYNRNDFLIIETALKALEIIKEKFRILEPIGFDVKKDSIAFGCIIQKKDLTKTEYDLLKEILL